MADDEIMQEELAADPDGPLHMDCIESPYYESLRTMIDMKLAELLAELHSGQFSGGDLAIKISFEMLDAVQEITVQDEGGESAETSRPYVNPTYDYTVAATLKKVSKDKAKYAEKRMFGYQDGRFIAAPVPSAQITMDELAAHR